VATKKSQRVLNDPVIKIGNPLPDNGTCKHYKKSYRWFRYGLFILASILKIKVNLTLQILCTCFQLLK